MKTSLFGIAVFACLGWSVPALASTQCGSTSIEKSTTANDTIIFNAPIECQSGKCPVTIIGNTATGTFTIIIKPHTRIVCKQAESTPLSVDTFLSSY